MRNRWWFSLLSIGSFMMSGCGTQTPVAPSAPLVGEVVTVEAPETRDLSSTTETVPNCGGSSSTIVKHPSMTVLTTHAIEWAVGGQVGVGAQIGGGVIPGGVDLSGTLESSISRSSESGMQQGTAWDLPAEPNTIMEYTLIWREVWQHGYVDVKIADGRSLRINVTYRTGVQSDIISQRKLDCQSGQAVSTQTVTASTQAPQPTTQSRPTNTLSRAEIDSLLGEGNWFCFPDRESGLAVRRILPSFIVQSPIRLVNTYQGNFTLGQVVPQIGATVELEKLLLQSECPSSQQKTLTEWMASRASDSQPFDKTRMDNLLGAGNWKCLSEFPYAVTVPQLKSDLYVQYPITFVTYYDSTNHSIGETIPNGQAVTVWLGGSISTNQCP